MDPSQFSQTADRRVFCNNCLSSTCSHALSSRADEKQPLLATPQAYPAPPVVLEATSTRPRRSCFRKPLSPTLRALLIFGILFDLWLFWPFIRGGIKNMFSGDGLGFGHMEPEWDGHQHECAEQAQWTHHDEDHHGHPHFPHRYHHFATSSFELPQTSDLLYFIGRGALSHGVVLFSNEGNGDKVGVEVHVGYEHDETFEETTVCRLQKGDNDYGVGIFSPPRWHRHPGGSSQIHFVVKVKLPSTGDLTEYKSLLTDMPLFFHHVSELAPELSFESVQFRTSNTGIIVGSLLGDQLTMKTSNAPIQGSFNATDSLELHTSNGHINANVSLANSGSHGPSRLSLHSSNGPVQANVTLVSHESGGGSFDIIGKTSNSFADIRVVEAPVDSLLTLDAHTSNSPIRATLPRAYEGSFDVTAMPWTSPTLRFEADVSDPAGRGRKRNVWTRIASRGHVAGQVRWEAGSGYAKEGSATLKTSNGPAELTLL